MSRSAFDRTRRYILDQAMQGGAYGYLPNDGTGDVEPTALVQLALGDDASHRALLGWQDDTGGFRSPVTGTLDLAATPLAAIALGDAHARRALRFLADERAQRIAFTPVAPSQPDLPGWPWTPQTAGWVEPTARVLLLARLTDRAHPVVAAAEAFLLDRACEGGGWNCGNPEVWHRPMPPFVQTTACALMALQGTDAEIVVGDARTMLLQRWNSEPGPLSLAQSAVALALTGSLPRALRDAVAGLVDDPPDDIVATCWALIALGDGLERIRVSP